jgi:maleylacetoacetate isomerase/maleylpyruvate isomerase
MELFNFFRSSASFRVRIALALKGLDYAYTSVHLARGEQFEESYASVSAARLVPTLREDDGHLLTQSLAIIEYLDETYPGPALLPADARGRARARSLAYDIACEIHPINNLRVLRYLTADLKLSEVDKNRWYRHWVETGLAAVERQLADHPATGIYCHGNSPTIADITLVPQIFNAKRFDCRLDHLPTVIRIFEQCMSQAAFSLTQPSSCPDAE